MSDVVSVDACSKWYGPVLGCSDITWKFGGGIVGLLGPNGVGKSTLMKMTAGLLRPSRGTVRVFGSDPFTDPSVRRRIGYAPEHEKTWDELTAKELVTAMAELAGVPRAKAGKAADDALSQMGMTKHQNRRVRGFSKGMRQRVKLATAIAHEPDLLILDEPLTGVDPLARTDIVERIKRFAQAGMSVVISSHVLYEIEALTSEILVIYRGQVLAEGNVYSIRNLIDKQPHRIRVECDKPHAIGSALASAEHIARIAFERNAVVLETRDPDRCYAEVADTVLAQHINVRMLSSPDNNLGAVFDYLTRAGGR